MNEINHEYYVSLEVAKLLKEVGFDWECDYHYADNTLCHGFCNNDPMFKIIISVPTLDVAQRWLREVKNIDINILAESISSHKQYLVSIWFSISSNSSYNNIILDNRYTTYEEAQEAGIKRALEIILEKEE